MNHRELIAALTPLHGAGEARAIVRMVMEERFGLSQTDLLLGKDTTLSPNDRAEMEKIAGRLLTGEPVQHVLGYADFCGHRFRVTPDVLIPRPETEELVAWATELYSSFVTRHSSFVTRHSSFHLLDLCTGSGCIAISLALAFPQAHVVGVDISDAALAIARDNAHTLNASNVEFLKYNILSENTESSPLWGELESGFSLLTANPPYVLDSEAATMSPTVLDYEPSLALFVPDDDPLRFYRAIAAIGRRYLLPGAPLLVEINAALADQTRSLFESFGYTAIQLRDDRFGRPRMLCAMMP